MKKTIITLGLLLLTSCSAFGYTMPRWGMTNIDVYLPESEYSSTIERVFSIWAGASNNRLKFRFNSTRFFSNNAPIKIHFLNEKTTYFIINPKRFETTGYFTNMDNGYINRANLSIYTINKDGNKVSNDELFKFLLPEIGYILGLEKIYGPCPKDSVMCYEKYGQYTALQAEDRRLMVEKYTRTGNDIRKNNPNTTKD